MSGNIFKKSFLAIAVLLSIDLNAQRFTTVLDTLHAEYPQEKLYLQLDRSVYNPGETIWFKAYLFAGYFPSLVSKTLYTELTDAKGKLLQRIILPVLQSSAAGSLEIPATASGNVLITCYTKWMLNYDSAFLYRRMIAITTPQKASAKSSQATPSTVNPVTATAFPVLQFFPEGGDMVQNVESRMAFKSTDHSGMPVAINADVIDSKGKKITSFSSVHDGMGVFLMQPQNNETYKAIWKDQQGQSHEKYLPIAKQNGIVLEADYLENQIVFTVKRADSEPPYPFVYVVAQMQQQQLYRAKSNIAQNVSSSGAIPTGNFPAGIVQLTVFSPDDKPLAERIVFINLRDHSFATDIKSLVNDFGKRQKNVIEIDVPDTFSCNLSVSVTDAELDPPGRGDNIFARLHLTSDIRGFVYDPAYYFSSDADSVAAQLDLVMMTNGWRRFKWENVLAGNFPALKYLPENYISVEGQVKGLKKSVLEEKEINGILEPKSKGREYLSTPVQPDGKFSFTGMIFYDTAMLFYQFNRDKKKMLTSRADFVIKSNLLKDPLRLQQDNTIMPGWMPADTATLARIAGAYEENLSKVQPYRIKMLQEVVVTGKVKTKKQLMDEQYTTGFFSDDPAGQSRIILPEDDPAFLASQSLFSYLQGRIAGLQVSLDGNDVSVTWRGFQTSLFVDEISQSSISFETGKFMEDPSYILSISMSEIAMVKIFNPPFFGSGSSSSGGEGGAISVYLKKGRTGNQMTKGLEFISLEGYSALKEFYSPDYSLPDHKDLPDYRTTLYWNPFIFTDKDHRRISLSFYNNDITKKMKVIIEGCNENGKLTRVEKIIQ